MLLPLFLLPVPSAFSLPIGEREIYLYFSTYVHLHIFIDTYMSLNLCINIPIYRYPCKRKQSPTTTVRSSGSAVLSGHQAPENPKAQKSEETLKAAQANRVMRSLKTSSHDTEREKMPKCLGLPQKATNALNHSGSPLCWYEILLLQ